jgi:hypothetical protein
MLNLCKESYLPLGGAAGLSRECSRVHMWRMKNNRPNSCEKIKSCSRYISENQHPCACRKSRSRRVYPGVCGPNYSWSIVPLAR